VLFSATDTKSYSLLFLRVKPPFVVSGFYSSRYRPHFHRLRARPPTSLLHASPSLRPSLSPHQPPSCSATTCHARFLKPRRVYLLKNLTTQQACFTTPHSTRLFPLYRILSFKASTNVPRDAYAATVYSVFRVYILKISTSSPCDTHLTAVYSVFRVYVLNA